MNIIFDIKLISIIQAGLALLMSLPLGIAIKNHEELSIMGFAVTMGGVLLISLIGYLFTRKNENKRIGTRDAYFLVTITWILATAYGAIPLVLSKNYPNFSFAFFEMMSGFTTTGASCSSDIAALSKSIGFWRSFANWLGGLGIVILFVALLPMLGLSGNQLLGAESVGPVKGKLTPKSATTALVLWLVYLSLTVIETVLLSFGGLSIYDAITVTFSTMGAAGFGTKANSIAGFNSSYVETIVIIFMFISGINFALFYKLVTKKGKEVFSDGELRSYVAIVLVASIAAGLCLWVTKTYSNLLESLRYGFFQIISVLTTTGFATANYVEWPALAKMLVFAMMFIGGCAGSAGGGMKVIRVATLVKITPNQLKKQIHPKGVFLVRNGKEVMSSATVQSIGAFCGIYLSIWIISSIIISLTGVDLETSITSTILTLGNIGIGFGQVGPTGSFSFFPNWALWVFSFLMLLGRLEIYAVLVLFTKSFWKKGA